MTTFISEVKKIGLNDEDAISLDEILKTTTIKSNEELLAFLSTLEEKYLICKDKIEIYLRVSKMIPYKNIDINQAYRMFKNISKEMKQQDIKALDNFFRTPDGEKIDLAGVTSILVERMKKGNKLECLSILYFVSDVMAPDEENVHLENEDEDDKNWEDLVVENIENENEKKEDENEDKDNQNEEKDEDKKEQDEKEFSYDKEKNIELVMRQAGVNRQLAINALKESNEDIVEAIMQSTLDINNKDNDNSSTEDKSLNN